MANMVNTTLFTLPPPTCFLYTCLPYMNPFSIYIFATYLQVVNLSIVTIANH